MVRLHPRPAGARPGRWPHHDLRRSTSCSGCSAFRWRWSSCSRSCAAP